MNCSGIIETYDIIITASKANYEQKSINFLLSVDASDSTLENIEGVVPKALSENISMTLFYYEPGNPIQNYTNALIELSLNLTTGYLIETVDYTLTDNLDGTYSIILYSGTGTSFNESGQSAVYLHASQAYVKNASVKVDIFLNPYTSRLTTNQTLFSSLFYQNVTLFINYTLQVDFSPILVATVSISGHGTLDYSIKEVGAGLYSIELNSSSTIETYNILVTINKTNYETKSLTFILSVDEFDSTLENLDAVTPKILSENITLRLFYHDPLDSTQNYTNALIKVSLNLSTNYLVESIDYISQDTLDGVYILTLYTGAGTSFNETGQYSIYAHASKIYVKNASRKVDLFLNAYATSLTTNQSVFTTGMNENVTLYLNYTLSIDTSPILTANMNISGQGGLAYHLQEIGNGIYTVEINSSNIKTSYDILIILSKTNHEQKSQSFILSVSEYNTMLTTNHSLIIQAQSNQNVTLYVNYTEEDGTPIDNANLYVSGITLDYTKRYLGSGLHSVEINASDTFANYDIILILNKTNFKQKSLSFVLSVNVLDSILEVVTGQSLINFRENLTLLVIYSLPSDSNMNYTDATIRISSEVESNYWIENVHFTFTNNLNGTYSLNILTGETVKINTSGQNIIHIHATQQNVRNATRSYSFFINPIQTELLINQTVFEIPKYEYVNFTIQYQTQVGSQLLDNASILIVGISNYTVNEVSLGLYEVIIYAGNESKSYPLSLIASKQNYAAAIVDIVLLVRNLDQFTTVNVSQRFSSITVGDTTEFVFSVYYDYTNEYLTDQNISITYQWSFGSGNLTVRNATDFVLEIDSQSIPPGDYEITIYIYDQDNNLFAQQQVTLTLAAEPIPPWLYAIIGAALLAIIMLVALGYYFKVHKPKQIFKNQELMDKYQKYLDAQNLQHLILIEKNSGLRIDSKTYGKETEVNDDLIAGFLQAISSFGTEISGVDTAMENIKYKGSKLLLEVGDYTDSCFVLKDEESSSLKQKALRAIEQFEERYEPYLKHFIGEVTVFEKAFDIFDEIFEIYLAGPFKINQVKYIKASGAFSPNKKKIMDLALQRVGKTFTLDEIFIILHQVKFKLADPEIFAELYDFIEKGILVPSTPIDKFEYSSKGN